MGRRHRPIHEERVVLVLLAVQEVYDVVAEDVLAVLALGIVSVLAVLVDDGVLVSGPLLLRVVRVPDAELIESRVLDPLPLRAHLRHLVGRIVGVELPLAGYAGVVARVRHQVPESNLVRLHQAESDVVAEVVLAGHQRQPRRSAQRHYVSVLEPHPVLSHLVEARRGVGSAAVRADHLVSKIVGHYQDYVRSVIRHISNSLITGSSRLCVKSDWKEPVSGVTLAALSPAR